MYESELQSNVSDAIINGNVDEVTLGITDNHRAVIIKADGKDAAYTADEARQLVSKLESMDEEPWQRDNDPVMNYIRDVADVVDRNIEAEEVEEKWDKKGRQEHV